MRDDITKSLREIVTQDPADNPFNQRDRTFAAALMEIRAALAKIADTRIELEPHPPLTEAQIAAIGSAAVKLAQEKGAAKAKSKTRKVTK